MILDLINQDTSNIPYKILNFPDGHIHVQFERSILSVMSHSTLVIKTRIKNYNDIFILKQCVEVVRDIHPNMQITLCITYLLAARYDRSMSDYDSFDLKIVCKDINDLAFRRVLVYEPHSVVTTSLLNHVEVVHPLDQAVANKISKLPNDEICFIPPDLGAVKRVEAFLGGIKKDLPIVFCNKHRILSTGEITGIDIFNPSLLKRYVVIYDDLCDGGRTFTELAKQLRATGIVEKIYLFVTHGLFSKGLSVLLDENKEGSYVDEIYTTDSYWDPTEKHVFSNLNVIKI